MSVELVTVGLHVVLNAQVGSPAPVTFMATVSRQPLPAPAIKTPQLDSGLVRHVPRVAQTGGERGAESNVTSSTVPSAQVTENAPWRLLVAASGLVRLASGPVLIAQNVSTDILVLLAPVNAQVPLVTPARCTEPASRELLEMVPVFALEAPQTATGTITSAVTAWRVTMEIPVS